MEPENPVLKGILLGIFNQLISMSYWTYMNILIPAGIKSVPHADGKSLMFDDGPILGEDTGAVSYTEEEYKQAYAVKGEDGRWYWKQTVEEWVKSVQEMFAD